MAGREAGDHPCERIATGARKAEHPGQRRRRRGCLGKIDLGVHVEVGEREYEIWEDVVVDVLVATLDAPQPAHHLPLLFDKRVVSIQIEDECGEPIFEKVTLRFLRDQAEAAECVGMNIGQVVGLHRVLHGDLPVTFEVGGVGPVADIRR